MEELVVNSQEKNLKIYLASKSPRRQQLLSQIGVEFTLLPIEIPEVVAPNEPIEAYSERITHEKLKAAWDTLMQHKLEKMPILCADTEVVLDNHILGKPKNYADAFHMLKSLSNRSHDVVTSVGIRYNQHEKIQLDHTKIYFNNMSDKDIHRYLSLEDYKDKAGSYGIQSFIGQFIYRIEGCFYSVMGLPLHVVRQLINEARFEVGMEP